MSVAVCRGPAVPTFQLPNWLSPAEAYKPAVERAIAASVGQADDDRPAQLDIWNAIQADKDKATVAANSSKTYVHPLVRRSSSLMSQKSLEICTESLGSETGSDDFSLSLDDDMAYFYRPSPPMPVEAEESKLSMGDTLPALESGCPWRAYAEERCERKELVSVNYRCSSAARSPLRSFPPPLPSMSRSDGPCLQMRPHRRDGRLVVEAVPVRSHSYLHAQRQGGRLRLSFIDCSVRDQSTESKGATIESLFSATTPNLEQVLEMPQGEQVQELPIVETKEEQEEEEIAEEEEEEMEEEEVEVVDRGTVVEVKVSTQPQMPIGGGATKVHRSTLFINKFVGSTPLTDQFRSRAGTASDEPASDAMAPRPTLRRVPSSTSTTTLAAAVAVASTASGTPPSEADDAGDDKCGGRHFSAMAAADTKLLFTSRRRDKQELLQSVRRCRQLRQKPLFILEPYFIATS